MVSLLLETGRQARCGAVLGTARVQVLTCGGSCGHTKSRPRLVPASPSALESSLLALGLFRHPQSGDLGRLPCRPLVGFREPVSRGTGGCPLDRQSWEGREVSCPRYPSFPLGNAEGPRPNTLAQLEAWRWWKMSGARLLPRGSRQPRPRPESWPGTDLAAGPSPVGRASQGIPLPTAALGSLDPRQARLRAPTHGSSFRVCLVSLSVTR